MGAYERALEAFVRSEVDEFVRRDKEEMIERGSW